MAEPQEWIWLHRADGMEMPSWNGQELQGLNSNGRKPVQKKRDSMANSDCFSAH
jgi:hypothetical protein